MDTTRLRVRPPCTRNQRPAASLDTVRHEQRSSEKRGHIYRTGLLTEGTHEAHRFPCCFSEILSPAEQAATYKRRTNGMASKSVSSSSPSALRRRTHCQVLSSDPGASEHASEGGHPPDQAGGHGRAL